MKYFCFVCFQQFAEIRHIFEHLKKIHLFRDNKNDLKCVAVSPSGCKQCVKIYKTFDSLRAHIKKCEPVPSISDESDETLNDASSNETEPELERSLSSCYIYEQSANLDSDAVGNEKKTNECGSAYYSYGTASDTDLMNIFLQKFSNEINSMCLTIEKTDKIFQLSVSLIENFKHMCEQLIANVDIRDALTLASGFTTQKLLDSGSAYKRSKNLMQNELFVNPEEKTIGTHWEMCKMKNTNVTIPRLLPSRMHYIPIKSKILSLFKQKEFRKMYFEHNSPMNGHVCEPGRYRNFCCGTVYKSSSFYINNPTALQLQISTDGFELCNPLGSKATIHSMLPIYFTIKNVPSEYYSKLSNIHLVSLCRSDDIKTEEADFNHLWELIVAELSDLEENGVQIDSDTVIKGTVSYLGYDNLGANNSTGFVESFAGTHFCRFCTASKKETETMTEEDESKIRTIDDYEKHLHIISESSKVNFSQTKGVKRACELNQLKHFHILRNRSVDIMHDLNEGAIAKLLHVLFSYCIASKLLTEDLLRKKVQFFDFGFDRRHAPSALNLSKPNLNQSATQIMCLFRHIGFIFIDFKSCEKLTSKWYVVEALQTVVQIAYSSDIRDEDLNVMQEHITIFLKGIKEEFKVAITPKMHFLLHYPGIIKEMGPIVYMSMMRVENKHKSLKNIGRSSNNFKNITKTISTRNEADFIYNGFTYKNELQFGKISNVNFAELDHIDKEIMATIFNQSEVTNEIQWFKMNDITYKRGFAILIDDFIYSIERVFIVVEKCHLLCHRFNSLHFCPFTHSIVVEKCEKTIARLIKLEQLTHKRSYEVKYVNSNYHVFVTTLDVAKAKPIQRIQSCDIFESIRV